MWIPDPTVWIPDPTTWIPDSKPWIPDSGTVVDSGFQLTYLYLILNNWALDSSDIWIPDSTVWIPDSKPLDSGFQSQ